MAANGVVLLVLHAFKQRMFKHIAQGHYALEFAVFVNDDKAVYARPPDRVVYG